MLIINWKPITDNEEIPPFGEKLREHIEAYKGAAREASCSAWSLLYSMMLENAFPVTEVSFTETGKPYFEGLELYFSLSHSKGICAAAIADSPVGIDVEPCRTDYNRHLVERSLTEKEKAVFDGDFTRLWCCKEAAAKLTGEGITGYPSNIETTDFDFECKSIEYGGSRYWLTVSHGNGSPDSFSSICVLR